MWSNAGRSNVFFPVRCIAVALMVVLLLPAPLLCRFAYGNTLEGISDDALYPLGKTVNTGTDDGFLGSQELRSGDPHFGWELGQFYATGYQACQEDGTTVFSVGPEGSVVLWFELFQDIDALGGDPGLSISQDVNGWDESLEVPKQDFGRGALIVTDVFDGPAEKEADVKTDFLADSAKVGIPVEIGHFGIGSYKVSLDYEVREDALVLFGLSILPSFTNYKISFSFDVVENAEGALSSSVGPEPSGSGQNAGSVEKAESGESEDAAPEPSSPEGMPVWQIAIILVAIGISSVFVIRGERASRRK